MKKKCALLSLVLSFMLVFTLVIPAFATAETLPDAVNGEDIVDEVVEEIIEDGDFTRSEEAEIEEDVEALDCVGLSVENIEDIDTDGAEIVYTLDVGDGIEDEISVENQGGDIVLNIDEDEIQNEVVVCENGDVIVDNEKIGFECESFEDDTCDDVEASSCYHRTLSCPNLCMKASEYTYKGKNIRVNIALQNKIGRYSVAALSIVISAIPGVNTIASIATGVATAILGEEALKDGKYLSCERQQYYKKSKKNFWINLSPKVGCAKESTTYYGRKNYKKKMKTTTSYYSYY